MHLSLTFLLCSDELPVPTQEQFNKWTGEYSREVGRLLADGLPSASEHTEGKRRTRFLEEERKIRLTRDSLIELRRTNETNVAKKAIRTSTAHVSQDEVHDARARAEIAAKMMEVLKLQQDIGTGTGAERLLRWKESKESEKTTGNVANAALAASKRAAEVK